MKQDENFKHCKSVFILKQYAMNSTQYNTGQPDKSLSPENTTKPNNNSACPPGKPASPMAAALCRWSYYYSFLVLLLVVLSAQGSFVNDMYTPALPSMCRFFGCSVPLGQLGLTMGMIGLGIGQVVLGPVSDKYGRRPVLIGATALFVIAAIASIFSPNIHVFNFCRFFQGVGASVGYFMAKTIPADVYSGRQLARLMALVGAINGIAPASAPVIGGFVADAAGWKMIFIILAVFSIVVISLSVKMKESLPVANRNRGSIFAPFRNYPILLRNKPFMVHTLLKAFALGLLFAYISSSPFILETHYGMSQTNYGLLVGANSLFLAAGSIISLKFKPYKRAAFIGSLIVAFGVIGLTFALYLVDNLWVYDFFMVVILFAAGMIFATSNTLAMNEGRKHSGEAAAIIGVAGYIVGGTVSPLVGMGNLMHSAALVNIFLAVMVVFFAFASKRQPADLD